MDSFEDLGVGGELVDALSSQGIEEPTPFQAAAIPVIRRGNHLLGRAGPGAGTLIAYGVGLLERVEPGGGAPRALVVTPTADAALRLAESLAPIAAAAGHTLASAAGPWVLPDRADLLFGTATELLAWARAGRLRAESVQALVVEQANAIQRAGGLGELEALLEFLPKDAQRVVLALPTPPEIEDFVKRHARRAVQLPPRAVEVEAEAGPRRGEVRYRIVDEPRAAGALQLTAELLEDARHVCLFFASDDDAADVGDFLSLHGYHGGPPGDPSAPLWLASTTGGELPARRALEGAEAVPVSFDAPTGPDALDRRHGGGRGGVVLALPREMPHLRDVAKRAGYRVVPFPPPVASTARGELDALAARLEAVIDGSDLAPWLVALEPLLERRGGAEVAAAAVSLLRAAEPAGSAPALTATPDARAGATPARGSAIKRTAAAPAPVPFVRLYLSLGERDGAGPRDIVGAITGEAGVEGSQIGRIEIRDTFSIVEVQEPISERVIRALNGVTVRGRSVRADYDRGASRGAKRTGTRTKSQGGRATGRHRRDGG